MQIFLRFAPPEKIYLAGSESYTKPENLFLTKIGWGFTLKNRDLGHLKIGYALVRPFLYFDLYFVRFTSTFRPFVESGLFIGRVVRVEVQFWSK